MTSTQTQHQAGAPEQELARLTLVEMGESGDCIAYFEGQPIGVFGGIVGEEVVAQVRRYKSKRRRKEVVTAIVTDVVTPSPHRITPPCPYFGPCTGCQWQHIAYPHQLTLKRRYVEREIARYPSLAGVPIAETMAAPSQFGYRNHARLTVRRQGHLGYVNRLTRWFVQVDQCMIQSEGINSAMQHLQGKLQETSQFSIRYGINSGEMLIQPKLTNPEITLESGQKHYREKMLGRYFRIASPSFFQVNTHQAERLITLVGEMLALGQNDTVIDGYAGVGTFAILLADSAKQVIAIEESEPAVKDARANAEGIPNVEFRLGKTEEVLRTLDARPDAVILDPPRVGCHPDTLAEILRRSPLRTAYVSCDPPSLARDLDILAQGGLKVERLQPVDMFPQTHHVECVAIIKGAGLQ
ncbi:MAG: 23S rRNA (uracil(1939)-C(5))-methyltransferase RlmD [SAR202 cluster bacterium]|nr:23S rRNA (uracil(1939)-C(5))-methyltransferase RlmD [SAR202 cluster bacterium]